MTIDEIVKEFAHIKYVGDRFSEYMQEKQEAVALNETENIMHKYQKIEKIISEWNNHCISTQVAISEIANEVLKDGNVN